MTLSILSLVATIVGFLIWLWKRKASIEDAKTPEQKHVENQRTLEDYYAKKDTNKIALDLDDALDHVERMQNQGASVDRKQRDKES